MKIKSIEEMREEFNKQFPCHVIGCDSWGNILIHVQPEDEDTLEPCQNCLQARLPSRDFWLSQIKERDEAYREEVEAINPDNSFREDMGGLFVKNRVLSLFPKSNKWYEK